MPQPELPDPRAGDGGLPAADREGEVSTEDTKGKKRRKTLLEDGDDDDFVDEGAANPKKKKRKINIFSSSDAPPSFDFAFKGSSQVRSCVALPTLYLRT